VARFEAMGVSVEGKLLVMGGFINAPLDTSARVDVYDPATDSWTQRSNLPGAQTHVGVAVDGPTVYLSGGFLIKTQGTTAESWVYDFPSDTWDAGVPLPLPRAALALVLLGRTLHAVGGLAADGNTDSADHTMFDLDLGGAWTSLAPLPNARNHLGGAAADGLLVIAGGRHGWDEAMGNQTETDVFDPEAGTWKRAADLPLGRSEIAAATFSVGQKVVVVGGSRNPAKPTDEVDLYDPATDSWQSLTPLPGPRKGAVAALIGNQIVVTTGSPTGVDPSTTTWIGCCVP
jgi:N-acetylneuraminic acid mutarotase